LRVTISNASDRPVLIERIPAGKGSLRQECEILQGGVPISYVGPMAKRRPYEKADFVELQSGHAKTRTIKMGELYAFPAGRHEYWVKCFVLIFDEVSGETKTIAAEPTVFVFAPKR
jgi:hypothetical protein